MTNEPSPDSRATSIDERFADIDRELAFIRMAWGQTRLIGESDPVLPAIDWGV
jgi:hypothetical protein